MVHTNDLHGQVIPKKNAKGEEVGGFAALAALVRRERARAEAEGCGFLLLDAGDFYQGTPEGDLTHGVLPLEIMNLLRYDAMTLGNHEFDQGQTNLRVLAAKADCPFLCANVTETATGQTPDFARPFIVKEVSGVRIGIVGMVTSTLPTIALDRNVAGLSVAREEEALPKAAAAARAAGAEEVFLLDHCGFDVDQGLAARFPEVPVIFGGHSHTGLASGWREPKTGVLVTQNFSSGGSVTRTALEFDATTHRLLHAEATHLVPREADQQAGPASQQAGPASGKDAEAEAIIAKYVPEIEKVMGEPVCEVAEPLTRQGTGSSALGNLLTDAIRESSKAEIAFHNRTGIRSDLAKGTARMREMYQLSPFGNTIVTMDLTGAEVLELLDHMLSQPRMFLEASGLTAEIDASAAEGKRVLSATVGGKAIERERVYRVATNNFLAAGGDGHEVFKRGRNVRDTGDLVLDAQVALSKARAPLHANAEPRIRPVRKQDFRPQPGRRKAA